MIRTLVVDRWSLFRRSLPTDVYLWIKAVLLAGIAIQLARLIWIVATPVGPFGEWRPPAARLLPETQQAALLASVDPFFRTGAGAAAGPALAVDLKLFGVRVGGPAASAILGPPDGEQQSYAVGEEVAPGVRLAAVAFDHVVLDQGGRQQKLFMPPPEGEPVAAPGAPAPAADLASRAFSISPRRQGDRITGAIVGPGSDPRLFAASGLRSGDVVVAVNGARITTGIDVAQLQANIAPGARLLLTVERGAETVPIALTIPAGQ